MDDIPTNAKKFARWLKPRRDQLSARTRELADVNLLALKTLDQRAASQSSVLVEMAIADSVAFATAYEAEMLCA